MMGVSRHLLFLRHRNLKATFIIIITTSLFFLSGNIFHTSPVTIDTRIPERFLLDVSDLGFNTTPADEFPYDVPDATTMDLKFINVPPKGICQGLEMILLVTSSIQNFEQRHVIRKTWASKQDTDKTVKVVFLLGLPKANTEKNNQAISGEAMNQGDIVQGSFTDDYLNLTVKSLVGFKWITTSCSEAKFVAFIDDDVYVNMKVLQSHVKKANSTGLLQCALEVHRNAWVTRKGKFAVPVSRYEATMWPLSCSGPCYLMSQDIARKLYTTSQHMHSDIGVADTFITGVVRSRAGIPIEPEVKGVCHHLKTSKNIIKKLKLAHWWYD